MLVTILMCLSSAAVAGVTAWAVTARRASRTHGRIEQQLQIVQQSLANASTATFLVDFKRQLITTSSTGAVLIGLPPERTQLTSAEWLASVAPIDLERCNAVVAMALKTGEPYVLDYRVTTTKSDICWLRSHGLPMRAANGRVYKIYGCLTDISQLKKLETEIRAREERFRDASIAANFYTWEMDLDNDLFTMDRPAKKVRDEFGEWVYRNESYSQSFAKTYDGTHPEDVAVRKAMIERIRNEDVQYVTETRTKNKETGEMRWHLSRGKLVKDASGKRTNIVRGIIQDIHDRKMADLKLKETEARLDRATRGTNDGLWEYDLAERTFWVSPRFAEMLGYEAQDFAADTRKAFEVTDPDDNRMILESFDAHIKHGEPVDIEARKKTKSGEWRWYRIRGAVERAADGTPLTISGSQQDVTEKRQYQQALIEATAQASAASKAKSEFLANMSHEIRTPMNGVIGMTELLIETPLNPMQRDYAETVRDSASALLTVINDILDFSKVEAGKLDLEHLDMDLRDTIEDVARLLAIQAHAKGLEVTALIDPTLPDVVRGDAGRLRQVLLNLGGNAVKFTKQGEVAIDCRVAEKNELYTIVRFEIRDTGIGIPQDRIGALFQAFSQVDSSTTRQFGGTGLGLSIVKRLVELMGGETGVRSEEGVGSVFWFTAKLGIAHSASKARPAPPAELKGQRVLLVDDNATNRKVIMGQLTLSGMEPMCASSADEALALMRQAAAAGKPFEVALLDHQMPGCDGKKLGQMIVDDPSIKGARLILLTSSGQRGDGHTFADLGFAGYLLKPVTQRDLTDCLMLVLASQAEAWHGKSQPIITRHALRTQRSQHKYCVLLAEDNAVNQKVACRTLEKLGYRVDVAADGLAAVKAWETGRYALILMDCQMPVLDGYEATRQIRAKESSGKRIPIVALTAHAMKGADEDCAAAGMDDYLTKPIDRVQLQATLDRWLNPEGISETENPPVVETRPVSELPVDWDRLLAATDQDVELAHELAVLFIDSGVSSMQQIIAALDDGDYSTLGEKVHEIKGASANLQATAAYAAAERLEIAARNGDTEQAPELAQQLNNEVERAVAYLRTRVA
jgi:two-component system, sensor histidine kinase and response regulator